MITESLQQSPRDRFSVRICPNCAPAVVDCKPNWRPVAGPTNQAICTKMAASVMEYIIYIWRLYGGSMMVNDGQWLLMIWRFPARHGGTPLSLDALRGKIPSFEMDEYPQSSFIYRLGSSMKPSIFRVPPWPWKPPCEITTKTPLKHRMTSDQDWQFGDKHRF